jgi:hypothetical protein
MVWAAIIGGLISVASAVVNWYQTDQAQSEARTLSEQETARGEEKNRFAENQTNKVTNEKFSQDQLDQYKNLLNSNVGLRNNWLSLWQNK